jgi:hypothetical protein
MAQGIDVQTTCDQSVADGSNIHLVSAIVDDPTLQSDPCAEAVMYTGQPKASPDYSGAGSFTIDMTKLPGQFAGPAQGGSFHSNDGNIELSVNLCFAGGVVTVPVVGAHLSLTKPSSGNGLSGQLNAAIRKNDVDTILVPKLAAQLDATVQANPASSTSMQLLSIFDTGDGMGGSCTNPDGSSGVANDHHISPCEVAGNAIIKNVLAPDVQLFQNGSYAPNPANTTRDSLSLGMSFAAVTATY